MSNNSFFTKCINYRYRVLRNLWLKHLRKNNHNHTFSLIANDCIGGTISYDLAEDFRSPTVKVLIPNDCYLSFVKNLKYYLSCEVVEKENSGKNYPVGLIVPKDDQHMPIELHFAHDSSFEIPYEKWMKRCKRVNYNELYFIWHFFDEKDDSQLREFDNLDIRKLIILHEPIEGIQHSEVVDCYRENPHTGKILEVVDRTGRRYLDDVNYLGFLNS